ncbi:5-methyltetrahydrofolate--homocysteine methyltransferase [Desulfacinum infernum DSM 9756]|uniref:5-methyltetrahydrofolate--homocysteine methyltransferase n=1 Tax=Desulfacinum infernum DSM 9756 TaxID=1121391 RepID=A0A1M5G7D8_9BACT|nr:methyltetrahydrofolate cobalamin methyltransferase [Desulfacinum infernum]SHF99636.1 5-methyltetrahydrofolate--homocysteine methyltransferase [Desulfacinum infernum DSM 9756]
MIIIGEKINGTRRRVAQAIVERDHEFIKDLARKQAEGGAHYLDVNAGTSPDREPEDMVWLIENIQEVVDLPLCLDSANPAALESGLQVVKRPALINSLSGEKARIEGVLPLAGKYQTGLVVLALDDLTGIPKRSEERLEIVSKLVGLAEEQGLSHEQLFIDPLVTAISTGVDSGMVTFETIKGIRQRYPAAHITCGLSNISFGLPLRSLINRTFLAMCMMCGLDSAIIDPNDRELMGVLLAAEMLLGRDAYCRGFLGAYRAGRIGPPTK